MSGHNAAYTPMRPSAVQMMRSRGSSSKQSTAFTDTTLNDEARSTQPDKFEQRETVHDLATNWEKVLDTTEEQDKRTVDTWKDELNNLLIFTGLFSAVVTSFTVQSYTWLQQDSAAVSVQLLGQISLQLASFTTSPGHVNSSVPALPLANVTGTFTPPRTAVNINVLWILSLTLSLIAALFAIAAQQWLRHLRLPSHLAVHTALKLRQLRYESLRKWQIPGIISLLPIVLQVAVVMFLAGLLLLLRSLDNDVVIPFIVFAGIGLIALATTAITPLFNISCPYKSPLVPTILVVLQWFAYPLALLAAMPAVLLVSVVEAKFLLPVMRLINNRAFYLFYVYLPVQRLLDYVRSFSGRIPLDLNQFWTHKELRVIAEDEELECEALSGSLLNMRYRRFERIKECVYGFRSAIRMRSVLVAVIRTLGYSEGQDVLRLHPEPSGSSHLHERAKHCVSIQQAQLLLDTLPQDEEETMRSLDAARILVLVNQAIKGAASEMKEKFFELLLTIRSKQSLAPFDVTSHIASFPALLIFENKPEDFESLSRETALQADRWSQQCFDAAQECRRRTTVVPEVVLASSAYSLQALTEHPEEDDIIYQHVRSLLYFLDTWKDEVCEKAEMSRRVRPQDLPFLFTPRSILSICHSLSRLATSEYLPSHQDTYHAELVQHLREICHTCHTDIFAEAEEYLQAFADALTLDGESASLGGSP